LEQKKTVFRLKNTAYLTSVVCMTQSSVYNQRLEGSRWHVAIWGADVTN